MIIPVFFSIDDKYAPYLSVALCSLIQNASEKNTYKIIILYRKGMLSSENMGNIISDIPTHFIIEFIDMDDRIETITDRMENRLRCDYFTPTIFYRLFIPAMFPEYKKAIYLDSDIVVLGDISDLFQINIDNYLLGACNDYFAGEMLENYLNKFVGVEKEEYFNSGILLMNLEKLRKLNLDEHFLHLYNTYHFECLAPDQDYLNAMCKGNTLLLSQSWNTMPHSDYDRNAEENMTGINIVHYFLFFKPWNHYAIQFEKLFWFYLKQTPYYDMVKSMHQDNVENAIKSEKVALETIMSQAEIVVNNNVTFKKIFESGTERRI
ncbi:MAG: glycosyltransferase family 8 protein [Oscillospiraceae bacterium]|nr:glycosyltransferase family 8 protein [Oscillospiraceae bacterium]